MAQVEVNSGAGLGVGVSCEDINGNGGSCFGGGSATAVADIRDMVLVCWD